MMVQSVIRITPFDNLSQYINSSMISNLFGKRESESTTGSIKFRPVWRMLSYTTGLPSIAEGEKEIIESSSGNTGVAIAHVANYYKFPCTIVLPENTRFGIINRLNHYANVTVIKTPASDGSDGAHEYVKQLVAEHPDKYYHIDQYSNPKNVEAHYLTTGPEIWDQSHGLITHFVTGIGTGGTITGVSQYLKKQNPNIKIVGVQPKDWIGITGLRKISDSFTPKVLNLDIIDEMVYISTRNAVQLFNQWKMASSSSLGYSAAANIIAAERYVSPKTYVVTILPDNANSYSGIL